MLSRMPSISPAGLGAGSLVGLLTSFGSGGCPAPLLPMPMYKRKKSETAISNIKKS